MPVIYSRSAAYAKTWPKADLPLPTPIRSLWPYRHWPKSCLSGICVSSEVAERIGPALNFMPASGMRVSPLVRRRSPTLSSACQVASAKAHPTLRASCRSA